MPLSHELFAVTLFHPAGELTWKDCSDIRKNGDSYLFKLPCNRVVSVNGGVVVAFQNEPTPDEVVSEGGLVYPTSNVLQGLK